MRVLIKDEGFQVDDLSGSAFTVLAEIQADDRYLDLPVDADLAMVAGLFDQLYAIRIPFVSFSDGRGFSVAQRLRKQGFTGRLRAFGHLISDQYSHARRCGFDEIDIDLELGKRQPAHLWLVDRDSKSRSYQDRLLRAG